MIDLLPDALADALGVVVSDLRREWRKEVEVLSAESRAIIAELKAQIAALEGHVRDSVRDHLERADAVVGALKDGRDGADGKSVGPEEVRALVVAEVEQAIKSLPVPVDGHTPTDAEL